MRQRVTSGPAARFTVRNHRASIVRTARADITVLAAALPAIISGSLTELEGLSFPEAVQRVADMAGVPMPARDAEMEMREAKRATLFDVMEMATKFFEEQLQAAGGAKARAYLRDRGLSAATQHSYRLGMLPRAGML